MGIYIAPRSGVETTAMALALCTTEQTKHVFVPYLNVTKS